MLVYIFACEGSYGGLHGIYDADVVEVQDMNYVQIHPTTLYSKKKGRRFLLSTF